jgi:hypothetical protein
MTKIVERRGDQVYVEYEDWDGNTVYEWQHDPVRLCACGKKEIGQCRELKVTTFTETYECGYVYNYTNHNGYPDNLISKNGKRVK